MLQDDHDHAIEGRIDKMNILIELQNRISSIEMKYYELHTYQTQEY